MASSSKPQIGEKVRVVAWISGLSNQKLVTDPSCMVSVHPSDSSDKVTLSFGDQISSLKNVYEVDQCYQQTEDTALIFSKEVEPQIPRVFDGEHFTFIGFGARSSGNPHMFRGSEENAGFVMLTMDEVLNSVGGGRHTVALSICESFNNRLYDLLDSKHREVHILEDPQKKTILKGLSKVPVKSMSEFQQLYCKGMVLNKPTHKLTLELPRRSHKVLTIHILACDEGTNPICVGKMNFVDLTGYEDTLKDSIDGTKSVEAVNKSQIATLLNVIRAINFNESRSRTHYRESKLARVLQDSLGGNNHISILVFLNPLCGQDNISAVSLASSVKEKHSHSHSCVSASANKASYGLSSSTKKHTNFRLPSSVKKTDGKEGRNLFGGTEQANTKELSASANKARFGLSSTTKKHKNFRLPSSVKKTNGVKGRILFGDTQQANTKVQANNPSTIVKPETMSGDSAGVPSVYEKAIESVANPDMLSPVIQKEDASVYTQCIAQINGDDVEKEENSFLSNEGQSPPLSVAVAKLFNDAKLFKERLANLGMEDLT